MSIRDPGVRGHRLVAGVVVGALLTAGCTNPGVDQYVEIGAVPSQPSTWDGPHGTYTENCGRNENGHRNADNVVASPGVPDAAQHLHDYVGNESTDAHSTDQSLAAAATTCGSGDQSSYFWPVLRPAGDHAAHAYQPAAVSIRFAAASASNVVAPPRFLRVLTGDARGSPQNVNARWTCTGFDDRRTSRYPLCPTGSRLRRIFAFPSCWDGRQVDAPDHRSHVVFPAGDTCPHGTFAVPALTVTVDYDLPTGTRVAIDTFPELHGAPETDHAHFIDVFPDELMATVVGCVNSGRSC